MSQPSNTPNKNNPDQNPRNERFQPKVLLIWLVVIVAIIALWYSMPGAGRQMKHFKVSELVELVKEGKIKEETAVMKPDPSFGREGYVITGQLVDVEPQEIGEEASEKSKPVSFRAEGRLIEEDFLLLREVIAEQRRSTAFQDILVSILPFLLIIGLLYFLFVRQIKNAGRGAMSFGKEQSQDAHP